MKRQLRRRFWIEIGAAAVSFVLLVLTLVTEEWIEAIFEASPDGGSGELEWLITGGFVTATVISLVLARLEWRRTVSDAA